MVGCGGDCGGGQCGGWCSGGDGDVVISEGCVVVTPLVLLALLGSG